MVDEGQKWQITAHSERDKHTLRVAECETQRLLCEYSLPCHPHRLTYHGNRLFAATVGQVWAFNIEEGKVQTFSSHIGSGSVVLALVISDIVWDPAAAERLVTADQTGGIQVWKLKTGELLMWEKPIWPQGLKAVRLKLEGEQVHQKATTWEGKTYQRTLSFPISEKVK